MFHVKRCGDWTEQGEFANENIIAVYNECFM